MARASLRRASSKDLDLLVRHRRAMWSAIADIPVRALDAADVVYRRWVQAQERQRRFVSFIIEVGGRPVASGCVWLVDVQPRPRWTSTTAAYLLSMYTEEGHRGAGHATRIVRAAMRWSKERGVPVLLLHASDFGEPIYRHLGFERTREMRRVLTAQRRPVRESRTRVRPKRR